MWALKPEVLAAVLAWRDEVIYSAEIDVEVASARKRPAVVSADGVAVVPLKGVITPQVSLLSLLFGGGSSLMDFREGLRSAVGNPDVGTVVMDIDSPGGLVDLVPETAAEIRAARGKKKIISVSNPMSASAAYWLASQADEVVVTPSGEAGSIGVYCEHRDLSGALEKAGLKPTLVSAGKYKVEGNPYEPLDDEARAALQDSVDEYYGMFVKDVAEGRGVKVSDVKSGYGEGRVLGARRAVEANLADRVDSLEGTLSRLTGRRSAPQSANAADITVDEVHEYSSEERSRLLETLAGLGLPIPKEEASA
jgi:signal peptide peptidase SppA